VIRIERKSNKKDQEANESIPYIYFSLIPKRKSRFLFNRKKIKNRKDL